MHQRGRLQRLTGHFVDHALGGQLAQLAVYERQELRGGVGVALLDRIQALRDVVHARLPLFAVACASRPSLEAHPGKSHGSNGRTQTRTPACADT